MSIRSPCSVARRQVAPVHFGSAAAGINPAPKRRRGFATVREARLASEGRRVNDVADG